MASHTPPRHAIFGLMAEFLNPQELLDALKKVHAEGYEQLDAYTPTRSRRSTTRSATTRNRWSRRSCSAGPDRRDLRALLPGMGDGRLALARELAYKLIVLAFDADDLMSRRRLELQRLALEQSPELTAVALPRAALPARRIA